MISKGEVLKIAKLARLELTEKEVEKMQKDMSAVLEYFNILKQVKSSKVKVKSSIKDNVVRKDEVLERPASLANNLVKSAPDKKDKYIKVKNIF